MYYYCTVACLTFACLSCACSCAIWPAPRTAPIAPTLPAASSDWTAGLVMRPLCFNSISFLSNCCLQNMDNNYNYLYVTQDSAEKRIQYGQQSQLFISDTVFSRNSIYWAFQNFRILIWFFRKNMTICRIFMTPSLLPDLRHVRM